MALVSLIRKYWETMKAEDRVVLDHLWPGVNPNGLTSEHGKAPDPDQLALGVEGTSYTWRPLRSVMAEAESAR